jgi:hypothetical protein
MNTELPDNVILPGGEVVPLSLTSMNPFDFLTFALRMQIKIYAEMMMPHDYMQAWRILWEPLLPTGLNELKRD